MTPCGRRKGTKENPGEREGGKKTKKVPEKGDRGKGLLESTFSHRGREKGACDLEPQNGKKIQGL